MYMSGMGGGRVVGGGNRIGSELGGKRERGGEGEGEGDEVLYGRVWLCVCLVVWEGV